MGNLIVTQPDRRPSPQDEEKGERKCEALNHAQSESLKRREKGQNPPLRAMARVLDDKCDAVTCDIAKVRATLPN